ncbi:mechanosensitive ion channel family protein [Colwellia sp. D2M02]|uniref:mechanosensitive ion channel family protein n=1 Tax=Colwellia sp. D2M02 TaxID=2841562 RepID=UPI001C0912D5|nr:mechanosensitive ion channel domain-containing protein [Colwellia sp. D2M02]MBU2893681.1 mechanosensitive ion channel family protein [Colwellia sp. D2M02]
MLFKTRFFQCINRLSYTLVMMLCFSMLSVTAVEVKKPEGLSIKQMLEQKETVQEGNGKGDNQVNSATNQAVPSTAQANDNVPADDLDRGQPRSAITSYIQAMRAGDLVLASQYLDFRNLSSKTSKISEEELTRQLGVVLNRTLWIDFNSISDHPLGELNDGLPSYRELIGKVPYNDISISLYLQRVPRKDDRVKIWKISNATVEKIPLLYQQYSYSPLGEWLAKKLPPAELFGVMLWQWLYFSLMLAIYYFVALLITKLAALVIKRIYSGISIEALNFITGPVALLLAIFFARTFREEANVTLAVQAVMEGRTVLTLAWCWAFFRFVELMKSILTKKFIAQDKQLAVYLLRPAGTVLKLIVVTIAVLHWLESLGFNASTLLAGLGIGGLAIALAAQKTVENIIGAITLYTSAPVKIGNLCKFGNSIGVVEEIGLRSTRIRTLDRTVIYVPNAKFIDMELENFSEREKMAFRPKLHLSPNTTKENMEGFLEAVREHIKSLALLEESPQRAHFKNYSIHGLELDILVYVKTTTFNVYLDEINQLNLAILALLNKHNCQLQVVSERT